MSTHLARLKLLSRVAFSTASAETFSLVFAGFSHMRTEGDITENIKTPFYWTLSATSCS